MASKLKETLESWPERLQLRLSGFENPPDRLLLALLGAMCGLLTGAIILAWHALIKLAQDGIFSSLGVAGFLSLPVSWRAALPVGGALLLGFAYRALPRAYREGGIVHVLERMTYHQGVLPLRNAAVQFLGSIGTIASGQSVGREGVAAHLGAATGSFLARLAGLPNHRIRTLVGCGVAAGIAASFDSPLSGVVFAMEVVMMEYSIAGFAPIILSAVGAAALLHAVPDAQWHLNVVFARLGSLLELPYLILCGCVAGAASAALTRLTARFARWLRGSRIWPGMLAAGAVTAVCALAFPQIMGVGFDTINHSLIGRFSLGAAIGITVAKIVATSAATAVSLPGGLIVPTLFIGSTLGDALGIMGGYFNPAHASNPGFYALLGMGAMMGAVFQAPLTGMLLVVELSGSTSVIFPAMLIVITAMLVAREVFGVEPEFNHLLRQRGMDYRNDPIAQFLRRAGVARAMDRRFASVPAKLTDEESHKVLESRPQWLLIREATTPDSALLLRAADLVHFLKEKESGDVAADEEIDLVHLPGTRLQAAPIDLRATLQEAFDKIDSGAAEALFVTRTSRSGRTRIFGVLTRSEIESTYNT